MLIWIPFILIALLLSYLAKPNNSDIINPSFFQVLLIIWLAWFISFGGKGMQDQYSYRMFYLDCKNRNVLDFIDMFKSHYLAMIGSKAGLEIGYTGMNILFNKLGFGYSGFLFITALFTNSLLVKFIYRYKTPVFSVLILLATSIYSQQANLLRQMIVVSIFLYAIKYIETKNWKRYMIWIVTASFIHMSAILLLVLYFIANKKISRPLMLGILFISIMINYFQIDLFFLSEYRVSYYNSALGAMGKIINEYIINWVFNLALVVMIFAKENTIIFNKKYYLVLNIFFVGVVLGNLIGVSFYIYRFSLYLTAISIIAIPLIPQILSSIVLGRKINIDRGLAYSIQFIIVLFYLKVAFSNVVLENVSTLGTDFYSLSDFFK